MFPAMPRTVLLALAFLALALCFNRRVITLPGPDLIALSWPMALLPAAVITASLGDVLWLSGRN